MYLRRHFGPFLLLEVQPQAPPATRDAFRARFLALPANAAAIETPGGKIEYLPGQQIVGSLKKLVFEQAREAGMIREEALHLAGSLGAAVAAK